MSRRFWVQSPVWSLFCTLTEQLRESSQALTNIEIWGFEQKVYQWSHLQGYFAQDGKPWKDESKVKEQKAKKTQEIEAGKEE